MNKDDVLKIIKSEFYRGFQYGEISNCPILEQEAIERAESILTLLETLVEIKYEK